jgi:hypothetical protein
MSIDMVFTDINLAGAANGWGVVDAFRAERPNVPVLYTSGKPVDPARLIPGSVFVAKPRTLLLPRGWKKDPHSKRYSSEVDMSDSADASDRGCLVEAAQIELLEFVSDRLKAADIGCETVHEPSLVPDFVFVEIGLR